MRSILVMTSASRSIDRRLTQAAGCRCFLPKRTVCYRSSAEARRQFDGTLIHGGFRTDGAKRRSQKRTQLASWRRRDSLTTTATQGRLTRLIGLAAVERRRGRAAGMGTELPCPLSPFAMNRSEGCPARPMRGISRLGRTAGGQSLK